MKKIDMSDIDYSKEIELINISVRGLHKFDPIKLLIENYLLFANDTNSIIDVNKVSDYIDYYIPNLVKDCNHIVEKLNIFREWRKQYLDKNLVCDKLLDFIEDNKLNLYLFLPRYYDILPLKFKNFGGNKGNKKLNKYYKEYLTLTYGHEIANILFKEYNKNNN